MSAATGGVDVLVFTGGVGEHSPLVQRRAVERLGYLGLAIDIHRNDTVHDDKRYHRCRSDRSDRGDHRPGGPADRR